MISAMVIAVSALAGAAPCNGAPELCARPYNEISYPSTHNAMASSEAGFLFPNQKYGLTRQLEDGIRALMLDIHRGLDNRPALCHSYCQLGAMDLVAGLREIGAFLTAHPREVVTLLLEPGGVDSLEIAGCFADAGLAELAYAQEAGASWPTLQSMIDRNKRLVVLTDRDPQGVSWMLPMWKLMWDNDWSNARVEDFDCRCNRGRVTNGLFNLNQFISNPLPSPSGAEAANEAAGIIARARKCQEETGRLPNFLTVDFHHIGDVVRAARVLNGLE